MHTWMLVNYKCNQHRGRRVQAATLRWNVRRRVQDDVLIVNLSDHRDGASTLQRQHNYVAVEGSQGLLLQHSAPLCLTKENVSSFGHVGNPLSEFLSASLCLSLSPFVMQRALFSFPVTSR